MKAIRWVGSVRRKNRTVSRPVEQDKPAFGHCEDVRTDLPQFVIAMTVTRDGLPVRCWTFSGNTAEIIRTVKDDLAGWNF